MTARLTIATALALGSLATLASAALAGYRWAWQTGGPPVRSAHRSKHR